MNNKERLYSLLDAIADTQTIAIAGKPLIIDPLDQLNDRIPYQVLSHLFIRLDQEKVLKLIQAPESAKSITDDLDPYDRATDGCWHIELLTKFERYYKEIQYEPEYQEFTGKKPANILTRSNGNTLMTYEQKLDLIVNALIEARKATRKGQSTTLHINTTNGLDSLEREEIRNILLQLQDENALKVNSKTNRLLPLNQQPTNAGYFFLEILDGFDDWYEGYLMRKKTELENIYYINILRIYDVVLDINDQIQLRNKTTVYIHLIPSIIRFKALFPADTSGLRDEYCENRWGSIEYLKEKGIITDYSHSQDGWDTVVTVSFLLSKFDDFYKKIQDEYVKRNNNSDEKEEKPKTESLKIDPTKVKTKVSYNAQKGELDIEGKKVQFKKESFRAKLLELLLRDDKTRKKEWSWDEVIEIIEDTRDEEPNIKSKNKFYPACDGLTKHIASKISVNDLLIFNKSTVQINPKYL